jgi:hypothetical protein
MQQQLQEHPILFSAPMIKAVLDGRKTQTRRVIAPQPTGWNPIQGVENIWYWCIAGDQDWSEKRLCPYGQTGDRLWVRETWRCEELETGLDGVRYSADHHFRPIENSLEAAEGWGDAAFDKHGKRHNPRAWRPSIFMPRWASRLTLEITDVHVERLEQISTGDIYAEGLTAHFPPRKKDPLPTPRSAFAELWDSLNASRGYGWDLNPWVWVVQFKRIDQP